MRKLNYPSAYELAVIHALMTREPDWVYPSELVGEFNVGSLYVLLSRLEMKGLIHRATGLTRIRAVPYRATDLGKQAYYLHFEIEEEIARNKKPSAPSHAEGSLSGATK